MAALTEQDAALRSLAASAQKAHEELAAATQRYELALQDVSDRLLALQYHAAVVATSDHILGSLSFAQMHNRHQQIQKEYPKTFSWAFDDAVTTLPIWLQEQDGVSGCRTASLLELWASSKHKDLVTASFYFWNGGSDMQKSQEGLLQSLVYQTFSKCPEIIRLATPKPRWEADENFHRNPKPWELTELKETFENIVINGNALSKCFCFFVDGLDEYTGDQFNLTEAFGRLAQSEWIKLCVSSRPWTVFQNVYGVHRDRTLVLQHLTKSDMNEYVTGMLEEDKRFKALAQKDDRALRLIEAIRERAQGVILWVFLVVRRLRRLLDERSRLETLEAALDALPSDLNDYFKHIVDAIEPLHRVHTAGTFQLAIYAAPLPLIAFWYLPTVLKRPKEVVDSAIESEGDDVDFIVRTREEINAWCKDLLEVQELAPDAHSVSEMDYRIDFLHRTVRDFLNTDQHVQRMFKEHLPSDFDAPTTMMRMYLAQPKTLRIDFKKGNPDLNTFTGLAHQFLYHAKRREQDGKGPEPTLMQELNRVGHHFRNLELKAPAVKTHWTNACNLYVPNYTSRYALGESDLLAFAVIYDLVGFVKHVLQRNPNEAKGRRGASLLNYALHPASMHTDLASDQIPSYDMVMLLLQGGARVDVAASTKSVWVLFLERCYHMPDHALWPTARLLLLLGAQPPAQIHVGSRQAWRIRPASHTAYRVAVPEFVTAEQCLERSCGDELPEMQAALKSARAAQTDPSSSQGNANWNSLSRLFSRLDPFRNRVNGP